MNTNTDTSEADQYVANARAMVHDFEVISPEEKRGAIKHAIAELQNARRSLPNEPTITREPKESEIVREGDNR